ncbi:hypothetical protein MKY96_32470 [Paenibacillus sp. FSL R7-0302]|uniref:hypothetical protein n=1 Tax=Paenibacillus sp. FSL R7-0302 TaxID=2921681 RepID=UPI0030FB82C3
MDRSVCLFFGSGNNVKLHFDQIVEKYRVRVWNGDKVFLTQVEETKTEFKGYANGVGDTGEIHVTIQKTDVVSISEAGTAKWIDVITEA